MKVSKTLLLGAAALISAGTLSAQNQTYNKASDWVKEAGISDADGTLTVQKKTFMRTNKFTVDPNKTYTVKATARAKNAQDKKTSWVLVGFNAFDKNGRAINSVNVNCIPATLTTVAADAKKGDTTLLVKDASKIKKGSFYSLVKDAKEDLSDLPNYGVFVTGIKDAVKKGDNWEITFSKPILRDIAAGTAVREQIHGGYIYTGGSANVGADWKTLSGSIKGLDTKGVWYSTRWPIGTVQAQFVILANWSNADLITEFKDISIDVQ